MKAACHYLAKQPYWPGATPERLRQDYIKYVVKGLGVETKDTDKFIEKVFECKEINDTEARAVWFKLEELIGDKNESVN